MVLKIWDEETGHEGWLFVDRVKTAKIEEGWNLKRREQGEPGDSEYVLFMRRDGEVFCEYVGGEYMFWPARALEGAVEIGVKLVKVQLHGEGQYDSHTYVARECRDSYLLSDEGRTIERL